MRSTSFAVALGVAFSSSVFAQSASAPATCESIELAQRELRTFGEMVLRLTRDQTKEGAEAKYQIGVKALERGWTSEGERSFISKYLSSEHYLSLQQQREPHRAAMAQAQALWRNGTFSASAQEICNSVHSAKRAVEASYKINQREQDLLSQMLERE